MNDCCNFDERTIPNVLVLQLKREIENLMKSTTAKLLLQDKKIAEMCLFIKENLSAQLAKILDEMKVAGEFEEIVTDVVLARLMDAIESTNVYFDGITTERNVTAGKGHYIVTIPKVDNNGLPIRLKVGIANDNKALNTVESTLDFAHRKNATVCVNAGVFDTSTNYPLGTVIYKGEILYNLMPVEDKYQFLGIKEDGTIKAYSRETTAGAMLADGVVDAIPIFGSLIENGVVVPQTDDRKEPRQAIGIKNNGDIVIITCDGRSASYEGMTYAEMASMLYLQGCYNAYSLDGGGSTSTVVRGVKQNENIDKSTVDREVSTFLYVARGTSVSPENNANNDIGMVKHHLLERIANNEDFIKGYIRVRSPEGHFAPGIEMYVNNETSRRSKLGMSYDQNNTRNTYMYLSLKAGTTEKTNLFRIYDFGCLVETCHGASSERPTATVGCCFFDTTLKKPIWYNGTNWIDASGNNV